MNKRHILSAAETNAVCCCFIKILPDNFQHVRKLNKDKVLNADNSKGYFNIHMNVWGVR